MTLRMLIFKDSKIGSSRSDIDMIIETSMSLECNHVIVRPPIIIFSRSIISTRTLRRSDV